MRQLIIVPATLTLGPSDPRLQVMLEALDAHIADKPAWVDDASDTDVILTDPRRDAVGLARSSSKKKF